MLIKKKKNTLEFDEYSGIVKKLKRFQFIESVQKYLGDSNVDKIYGSRIEYKSNIDDLIKIETTKSFEFNHNNYIKESKKKLYDLEGALDMNYDQIIKKFKFKPILYGYGNNFKSPFNEISKYGMSLFFRFLIFFFSELFVACDVCFLQVCSVR